jgi:hypothetical protein
MNASMKKSQYLSKSLFIKGLQCHKSLYLEKHQPQLKDPMTASKEALFTGGHEVGRLARGLFPGGVEIPYGGLTHQEQIEMTRSLIEKGTKVLYEAAFSHDGVFIKADIIRWSRKGWELYEVKASNSQKDYHSDDVSVQYYVMTGCGLPVSKALIVHLDNTYVRKGNIEIDKLFAMADLTEDVVEKQSAIKAEIRNQRRMLAGGLPDISIGKYCFDPYQCDYHGHCWARIPEISVFSLKRVSFDAYKFHQKGIIRLEDVPLDDLSSKQRFLIEAYLEKKMHVDPESVRAFLKSLRYPLCFLDFETFMTAIPPWDGIKPWQQVPYQYSLHVLEKEGKPLKHHEYLAMPNVDPRKELMENLMRDIPDNACVVHYTAFEKTILNGLAVWFPKYRKRIETLLDQSVDLAEPFKDKSVYLWQTLGSYSIKCILPALVSGMSYDGMEISDGEMASEAYARMCQSKDPAEIERIRKALLEYCKLDTLAMVRIVEKLKKY